MSVVYDLPPERDPRPALTNLLRQLAQLFVASIFVATFTWLLFATLATLQQGYGWTEMDWNGDGVTSIAEFLESGYVGRQAVVHDDLDCLGYFTLTDGRLVRTVCPQAVDEPTATSSSSRAPAPI